MQILKFRMLRSSADALFSVELGLPVCILTVTLTDKIHTKLSGNWTKKIKHSRFHKLPSKMLHCFFLSNKPFAYKSYVSLIIHNSLIIHKEKTK